MAIGLHTLLASDPVRGQVEGESECHIAVSGSLKVKGSRTIGPTLSLSASFPSNSYRHATCSSYRAHSSDVAKCGNELFFLLSLYSAASFVDITYTAIPELFT